MKKVVLPKKVNAGPFEVELILIPHEVAYESSDYQGSFVSKPPLKIYLDEDIINKMQNCGYCKRLSGTKCSLTYKGVQETQKIIPCELCEEE